MIAQHDTPTHRLPTPDHLARVPTPTALDLSDLAGSDLAAAPPSLGPASGLPSPKEALGITHRKGLQEGIAVDPGRRVTIRER